MLTLCFSVWSHTWCCSFDVCLGLQFQDLAKMWSGASMVPIVSRIDSRQSYSILIADRTTDPDLETLRMIVLIYQGTLRFHIIVISRGNLFKSTIWALKVSEKKKTDWLTHIFGKRRDFQECHPPTHPPTKSPSRHHWPDVQFRQSCMGFVARWHFCCGKELPYYILFSAVVLAYFGR